MMLDHDEIAPERIRPLRRSEYERLVEMGAFDGEKVELLYGRIVRMSPIGVRHIECVRRLTEMLVTALYGRASVLVQSTYAASETSAPEPDVAIIPRRTLDAWPNDAFWIIEVADSSLDDDRKEKAPLYASALIPEYWIVNLVDDVIEVHRSPSRGRYHEVTRHERGETLHPLQFPDVAVRVDDALPPKQR